jgi:hypothetical protein
LLSSTFLEGDFDLFDLTSTFSGDFDLFDLASTFSGDLDLLDFASALPIEPLALLTSPRLALLGALLRP